MQETRLSPSELVIPLFMCHGVGVSSEVPSMPDVFRYSVDRIVTRVGNVSELGVKAVLLFGLPKDKDEGGSEAYDPDGIVQQTIRRLKKEFSDIVVMTDVCLCGYTSHGHCGVVRGNYVDNDATLELLSRIAVSHAEAGADIVAPSAMMDGQVRTIRRSLDRNGFKDTAIMAYSAKFASSFYGPFRDAVESTPSFGDRRGYQMDPSNWREAIREISLDVREGADIVMVKPALPYLDIIYRARRRFNVPIAAYNVSGEYVALKSACKNGWLNEEKVILEVLTSIKRAGADIIITYFAERAAALLEEGIDQ